MAAEFGSTVIDASGHRRGTPVGDLGVLPEVDKVVFSASVDEVVEPVDAGERGVLVARVKNIVLADETELVAERENLRARMMADRAGQLMRSILNERRRDTMVTVNDDLLQRFAPTTS